MADMTQKYRYDNQMTEEEAYVNLDLPTNFTREEPIPPLDSSKKEENVKLKRIVIGLGIALILTLILAASGLAMALKNGNRYDELDAMKVEIENLKLLDEILKKEHVEYEHQINENLEQQNQINQNLDQLQTDVQNDLEEVELQINQTNKNYEDHEKLTSELIQKVSSLEASLQTSNEKRNQNSKKFKRLALCPIFYNEKCFLPFMSRTVDENEASDICFGVSGQLANIYNQTHFELVIDVIRSKYLNGRNYVNIRVGMKVTSSGILYLSNGNIAPYAKWSSRSSILASTSIIFRIWASPSSSSHYLSASSTGNFYFMCEI